MKYCPKLEVIVGKAYTQNCRHLPDHAGPCWPRDSKRPLRADEDVGDALNTIKAQRDEISRREIERRKLLEELTAAKKQLGERAK